MRFVGAGLALAAVTFFPSCKALNVTVPETIQAGVSTEITVGFDTWKQPYVYNPNVPLGSSPEPICVNPDDDGCSTDGLYKHYQLYLFTEEWQMICYLSDLIPTGTTHPPITIPRDIGPSEDGYSITAIEFNGTVMYMPNNGVATSNTFTLTGTTVANWTTWESFGGWLKPYSSLPCTSYACFRSCGLKYSNAQGTNEEGTTAALFACFNSCPGVVADPSNIDSLWSWYCNTGDGCANVPVPSDATTVPAPTNVIASTVTGSSWASILAAATTQSATTAASASVTAASATGSSSHTSIASSLAPFSYGTFGVICVSLVDTLFSIGRIRGVGPSP